MKPQSLITTIVMIANLALIGPARATDWQVGIGDWSTGSNWTNGEPVSIENAYIINGGTAQITQAGEECASLYLGYSSGQSGNVTQTSGTNMIDYRLYLSYESGSTGTYELSGTGQLSADDEYIGRLGTGTLTQTGGTNMIDDGLYIGRYAGSSGTYELSGTGELSAHGEDIGLYGIGTFIQTGGTNTVGEILMLGSASNSISRGTYELSGTGQLSASIEYIGYAGTGIFAQAGGTNTVENNLYLGYWSDSKGMYTISDGQLSTSSFYLGFSGEGTFEVIGDDAVINVDSYTQNSSGELYSIFDSDGLSVIEVLGGAELGGDWYIEDAGLSAPVGTFDVLTAAGGISGGFSNVYLPDANWNWGIDGGTLWVEHVPEPCTLSLLFLGGLIVRKRRV